MNLIINEVIFVLKIFIGKHDLASSQKTCQPLPPSVHLIPPLELSIINLIFCDAQIRELTVYSY